MMEHNREGVGVAGGLIVALRDVRHFIVRHYEIDIDEREMVVCLIDRNITKAESKLADAKPEHIWDDERIWDAVRFITARSGPCVNHKSGYDCFSINIGQTTICEPCQATRVLDQLKNNMPSNTKPYPAADVEALMERTELHIRGIGNFDSNFTDDAYALIAKLRASQEGVDHDS